MASPDPENLDTTFTAEDSDTLAAHKEHAVDDPTPVQDPATLRTVLFCSPRSMDVEPMRQYFQDDAASGGGPVEEVEARDFGTFLVHFKNPQDAANVVRRHSHRLFDRPLLVFLYDEQSRSVYCGRQAMSYQEVWSRLEHDVDDSIMRGEMSKTVLLTGMNPDADDTFRHGEVGGRPVRNTMCLTEQAIAFIQFRTWEDTMKILKKKHVSFRARNESTTFLTNVFLFRGPLPNQTEVTFTSDAPATNTMAVPAAELEDEDVLFVQNMPDLAGNPLSLFTVVSENGDATPEAPWAPTASRDDSESETESVERASLTFDLQLPDVNLVDDEVSETPTHEQQDERFQAMLEAQAAAFRVLLEAYTERLLHRELGQMRERMEAMVRSEVSRIETRLQNQLQNRLQTDMALPLENLESEVSELRDQMRSDISHPQNQIWSDLRSVQTQMSTNSNNLQTELIQLETRMTTEITQLRTELNELRNQMRSEAIRPHSELRSEISHVQDKLKFDINMLQNKLHSEVSRLQSHLRSEVSNVRCEALSPRPEVIQLRDDVNQQHSQLQTQIRLEVDLCQSQLRFEINLLRSLVTQLQSSVGSSSHTQSMFQMQDLMADAFLTGTSSFTSTLPSPEFAALKEEIQSLSTSLRGLRTQLAKGTSLGRGQIVVQTRSHPQQSPQQGETASLTTVAKPSASSDNSLEN